MYLSLVSNKKKSTINVCLAFCLFHDIQVLKLCKVQEFFIDVDKKIIKLLIEINHKTNIKTKTKMKVNVNNQNKNNLPGFYDYTS